MSQQRYIELLVSYAQLKGIEIETAGVIMVAMLIRFNEEMGFSSK